MQYFVLAVALAASPGGPDEVQEELMDAREQLSEFQQEDLKPLGALMAKAQAAAPPGRFPGVPASLLERDEPDASAADAVDADGKTAGDHTLEKEEQMIRGLKGKFDAQWKALGATWDESDKKNKLGKYEEPLPKLTVPKVDPQNGAPPPSSLAETRAHRGRAPILDSRDALAKSADALASFVSDQEGELKQLGMTPSSFVETAPRRQSEADLAGLRRVSQKLKAIEDRLRAQAQHLQDAGAKAAPSSFAQTSENPDDGFAKVEAKLKALQEKIKADTAKFEAEAKAPPSSFAETGAVDFKHIEESLKQLKSHVEKQAEELRTKGFFDSPPSAEDDDSSPGSLVQTGGKDDDDPAEAKKEVAAIVAQIKAEGARAKKHAAKIHDAEDKLGKLRADAEADKEKADADLKQFPDVVAAEQAAMQEIKAKKQVEAREAASADAEDTEADVADASSFIETDRKAPGVEWYSEQRKEDFDAKQASMAAEDKKLHGAVDRMEHARKLIQKDLAETQAHEKQHPHSKIYAKLRAIALGKEKPDHAAPAEADLRTDEPQ